MIIRVYLNVDFLENSGRQTHGFKTHIINLSNQEALEKLIEHIQCETLDLCGLKISDFRDYDPERD